MKVIYLCLLTVFVVTIVTGIAFAQDYQIYHAILVLNPIPSSITEGNTLTFSGSLLTADENKDPVPNKTIFIEYDSPYDCTRILASATTDSNGNFAITWKAHPKHSSGGTYYLFAKFNGDDQYFYSISSKRFPLTVTVHESSISGEGLSPQTNIISSDLIKNLFVYKTGFAEHMIDGLGGCNGN